MSNHYHVIVNLDPSSSDLWSDEDIADRWLSLSRHDSEENLRVKKLVLLQDKQRLAVLKERLCSLSWFMKYINEPLARMANSEDDCKGRFWEGRFKSQRLLDAEGLLGCLVYVDLNPTRAGLAQSPEKAMHTSLHRRTRAQTLDQPLTAIDSNKPMPIDLSLRNYIQLCRWTVQSKKSDRPLPRHALPTRFPQVVECYRYFAPGQWQRAIGTSRALQDYARAIGQSWIKTNS
jgi:hypothetical protein